jgi:hypothetical protein
VTEKAHLHDANVLAIDIDVAGKALRIHVVRYESLQSKERFPSTIEFKNVHSFSGMANLVRLATHAPFGNVADWEPSKGAGLSFVYFAGGVFSVHSDEPIVT